MKKIALWFLLSFMSLTLSTIAFAQEDADFIPTKVDEANQRLDTINKNSALNFKEMYTNDDVNLREKPTTESVSLKILPQGTKIIASEYNDIWSVVKLGDFDYAYVSSSYISDELRDYSDDDLWWMAHLLAGEMMDESWEDQVYTGSVCLNRVQSDKWPGNSLEETITQKKWGIQYACYWDGNFFREPTGRNWEAAKYLLENGSQIPSNVYYQSGKPLGKVWKQTSAAYYCYD